MTGDAGFMHLACPGSLLVIPGGYIIILFAIGDEASEGLRWSFTRTDAYENERKTVLAAIEQLTPEYGSDSSFSKLRDALSA